MGDYLTNRTKVASVGSTINTHFALRYGIKGSITLLTDVSSKITAALEHST